jgi:ribosomal protein RSM22 (predicted rRNA methylase)
VHQDPQWRELSQRLNLDLRVLPYSFVALDRGTPGETAGHSKKEEEFRVLGVPREFKGHLKVLACNADGLTDWTLQKRDAPELYKEIRSAETLPMYRWKTAGQKIIGV